MIKRVIAGGTVAVVATLGLTAAAQATARTAQAATRHGATARPVPPSRVVNLHRAFEARLGHVKVGKIAGIVYARGRQPKAATRVRAGCSEPNCPLVYNGGLVQQRPHVYLLLWGPDWSDSSEAPSATYLENFYAGLGVEPQDTWSPVTSQYGDGSGVPTFTGSVYEGAFQDTSTPPSGVTDSQLAAEADAFTSTEGISDLNDAQIVVATQSGTCPEGFYAPGCDGGTGDYCAWHSSSNEPFTNLPYILDAGAACGEDFVNSNGTDDGFSIVGGHEYAESITDPYPDTGWIDPNDSISGGEVADKCAWRGELWGSSDPAGDVKLSTGSFAMQSLWSNSAGKCVMSSPPAGHPVKGEHGKCLDDHGASTVNGNKIDIWTCNGTAAQDWTLNSNGTLSVLGSCLADKHYTGAGTKLVLWSCIGNKNEQWRHKSDGEYVLATNGLCLTDPSGSKVNGTPAEIRACHDYADQRWSGP
jgi:Ricin-type beta-trefoil lectin domain